MKDFTNKDLEKLLGQLPEADFRPFFGTRVLARLERYQHIPVLGQLIANRLIFRRYIYIASFCLLLLLGFCVFQEGSISLNHLLGLGGFSEEDLMNYINPVI